MSVLIIEWTGVGGIAEATRSWYSQARAVGPCTVLTTLGGALHGAPVVGIERGPSITGYTHQVEMVHLAVDWIRRNLPRTVVMQGYVMPHEEQRVLDAAHGVGAIVVQVVYMPSPPFLAKGSSIGLRKLLRSADVLVAHAEGVADRLRPRGDQRLVRSPFPPFEMSTGVLGSPPGEPEVPEPKDDQLIVDVEATPKADLAGLVDAFARHGQWSLAVPDLPRPQVPLASQRGWIDTIGESRAALIPSSSPFGNIMASVAMGLGVVPVVRHVGAQSEQIGHGSAGILVPERARPQDWVEACEQLHDDETVERYIGAGFDLIERQSAEFAAMVRDVLT